MDSPGIIPAKMVDQSDAILLAACNCVGQAAYDNQVSFSATMYYDGSCYILELYLKTLVFVL